MSWDEFTDLLSGLSADTPLGRMVQLRTETNEDILKEYTAGERQIRAEWQKKVAKRKGKDEVKDFLDSMEAAFRNLAAGGEA